MFITRDTKKWTVCISCVLNEFTESSTNLRRGYPVFHASSKTKVFSGVQGRNGSQTVTMQQGLSWSQRGCPSQDGSMPRKLKMSKDRNRASGANLCLDIIQRWESCFLSWDVPGLSRLVGQSLPVKQHNTSRKRVSHELLFCSTYLSSACTQTLPLTTRASWSICVLDAISHPVTSHCAPPRYAIWCRV